MGEKIRICYDIGMQWSPAISNQHSEIDLKMPVQTSYLKNIAALPAGFDKPVSIKYIIAWAATFAYMPAIFLAVSFLPVYLVLPIFHFLLGLGLLFSFWGAMTLANYQKTMNTFSSPALLAKFLLSRNYVQQYWVEEKRIDDKIEITLASSPKPRAISIAKAFTEFSQHCNQHSSFDSFAAAEESRKRGKREIIQQKTFDVEQNVQLLEYVVELREIAEAANQEERKKVLLQLESAQEAKQMSQFVKGLL